MPSDPLHNIEARLDALERAAGNPHRLTQGDVVSLKEHIESRFAAIEKAIEIALAALDKRLDGMNEIREAMRDQSGYFISRKEVELQLDKISADITALKEYRAEAKGKASMLSVAISALLGIAGIVIGVIGLLG